MKITEVVAALIWQGDKFMICQRPVYKARGLLWEFVGGKVEPGETKEQALIREHEMYTCDARFRNNIDKYGDKTAEFTAEAIAVYCEKTKGE